jgi:hypothetical protein
MRTEKHAWHASTVIVHVSARQVTSLREVTLSHLHATERLKLDLSPMVCVPIVRLIHSQLHIETVLTIVYHPRSALESIGLCAISTPEK